MQKSWNRYGENNFSFDVIEVLDKNTVDYIDKKEIEWIQFYKEKTGVYNIQPGGQPKQLHIYVSPEQRRKIGEMNRQRMLGSKLSEATRKKMSESRKGKRIRTKRDSLSDEQAKNIKKMLIANIATKEIVQTLQVDYKSVNNILSNNAYSTIHVDGWDEFVKRHKREVMNKKKASAKLHESIILLHKKGFKTREIAKRLKVTSNTVCYHIKKQIPC